MKPVCLLSLIFLLSGCHSAKKAISTQKTKETSQISQVSEQTDSVKSDAHKQTKAIDKAKKVKTIEQSVQSVTEKYDTSGRVTERTTTVTKSQLQEQKQADKTKVAITERQVSGKREIKAEQAETVSKQDESFHKEAKRKGMGIWVQIGMGIAAAPLLLGLFRTRKSWLPTIIGAAKSVLKWL